MAAAIPTAPPEQARAGDTWVWDDAYPNYPVSELWVLTYELRGMDGTGAIISLTSALTTASGDGWRVTVPASTTKTYFAGHYEFLAVLTGAGDYAGQVYTVTLAHLTILPNLITASTGDRISHAQAMLDLVRTAIAARIRGDEPENYMVDGVNVTRMNIEKLEALERIYAQRVARLQRPSQFGTRVQYRIRVPSP